MTPGILTYHQSMIAYRQCGAGDHVFLCFHGYGEDARSFDFLEKYLPPGHRLLAIDLPFHGQTDWKEGNNLSLSDWNQILLDILKKEGVAPSTLLTVVGYSLGGRVALQCAQDFPDRIKKLVLLAPDGLKVNFWYWLSTQTAIGNRLFKGVMKYPGFFFFLLKGWNRLGWINTSIFKFVQYYIGNPQVRTDLYRRWTTLRKIKPHLPTLQRLLKSRSTPVVLVYGQHDRIILPQRGYQFQKALGPICRLEVIDSGHQVLHEKHQALLIPLLLS